MQSDRKLILDTETTGLDFENDKIIEIGIVELRENILTQNYFHEYINPEKDISLSAQKVHGISNEFLIDKPVFSKIAQKFLELSYKQESIAIAKVTSSVQLSAQQQQNIAEKLKVISGAKQIKLALKVDPQLIGGFTVEIGSKLIDTSIRGQLRQISSLLGA